MARSVMLVLALAAAAAIPRTAAAQEEAPLRLSKFDVGLEGAVAQPLGAFKDEVNVAGGATLHGAYHFTPVASLRAEVTYLIYGHERQDVCGPSSCRVMLDLSTNNQIVSGFIGPQFEVPTGPIRPYVRGGIGFGYFFTSSSLTGSGDVGSFADTNNYDDGAFALMGGGGMKIPFQIRQVPVSIDFGAQYQRNGDVSYLRKGSIVDHADGSYTMYPIAGPADFVQYHLGFSVTVPHSTGHHHYRH
ncbi:MAG TPA: outer membrane beta-barrel protein [Longimicrobiales bacterium]